MGPVTAVSSFFGRALDFYGRSRRLEYIWMLLFSILVPVIAVALFISLGIDEEALETGQASPLAQVIIWTFCNRPSRYARPLDGPYGAPLSRYGSYRMDGRFVYRALDHPADWRFWSDRPVLLALIWKRERGK